MWIYRCCGVEMRLVSGASASHGTCLHSIPILIKSLLLVKGKELTTSPRRTIATAQTLYMRFHLFFPYKDFNYVVRALILQGLSKELHMVIQIPPFLASERSSSPYTQYHSRQSRTRSFTRFAGPWTRADVPGSLPLSTLRLLQASRHPQETARYHPLVISYPIPPACQEGYDRPGCARSTHAGGGEREGPGCGEVDT